MATKYPADGNLYIGFLADPDGDAITDIMAPETAELSSIVDLSCDVQSGGVDMGISTGTIDTTSVCSAFLEQALGRTTVAPNLTFWRYKQPDDTAWDLFEKGLRGWLVIRTGVPSGDALADGDEVTLAYVDTSEPTPAWPGGDTASTFAVQFVLVSGSKFTQKAVIGGAGSS